MVPLNDVSKHKGAMVVVVTIEDWSMVGIVIGDTRRKRNDHNWKVVNDDIEIRRDHLGEGRNS